MTAEIAIMNKMAVALAADSAVTISAGPKEEKIFDSADKLFELSNSNPIGIMINNGLSFMQVPLPNLIRSFRNECGPVDKVEHVAEQFLRYLHTFGKSAPASAKKAAVWLIISPIAESMNKRLTEQFQQKLLSDAGVPNNPKAVLDQLIKDVVDLAERIVSKQADAQFIGDGDFKVTPEIDAVIEEAMTTQLPMIGDEFKQRLLEIGRLGLRKAPLSPSRTGIVIAGFGSADLFPTLISFDIDGMVCGHLKYVRTNYVDIDRDGSRAAVAPFAQKEMVERFLYGLDEQIERVIVSVCKETVPTIRNEIAKQINFKDAEHKQKWEGRVDGLEQAFIEGLNNRAFKKIRDESRSEIEDMVEFMPKPELAKMAEALVNLTSIKRRVSRGMETVGGPIDVAVISQSEGFVWIKRKHYFPAELNMRFQARVQGASLNRENGNGLGAEHGRAVRARGSKGKKRKPFEGPAAGGGDHKEGNAKSIFGEPERRPKVQTDQ